MKTASRLPSRLEAVLEHVATVREVHDYVTGAGFEEDARQLQEVIRRKAESRFAELKEWEFHFDRGGHLYWYPEDWNVARDDVARDDYIKFGIALPSPVDDNWEREPFAYLYVPKCRKKNALIERLRRPKRRDRRYEHIDDGRYRDTIDEDYPVWVPASYAKFARRRGSYDSPGLVADLVKGLGILLALKPKIDALLKEPQPHAKTARRKSKSAGSK